MISTVSDHHGRTSSPDGLHSIFVKTNTFAVVNKNSLSNNQLYFLRKMTQRIFVT